MMRLSREAFHPTGSRSENAVRDVRVEMHRIRAP
jgi:hypothetical protein